MIPPGGAEETPSSYNLCLHTESSSLNVEPHHGPSPVNVLVHDSDSGFSPLSWSWISCDF